MPTAKLLLVKSLLILFVSAQQPPTPPLRTRVALNEFIREPAGLMKARPHTIGGMTFSHSGTKIAVAAGGHISGKDVLTHILIVDLEKPQPAVTVVDTFASIPGSLTHRRIQWSGDDRLLLYSCFHQAILIDEASGAPRCAVNNRLQYLHIAGFAEASQFVVLEEDLHNKTLYSYDFNCHLTFERNLSGITSNNSAFAHSLMVFAQIVGMSILRAPDWEPQPVADEIIGPHPVLLENGQTLCAGHPASGRDGSMKCWLVQGNEAKLRGTYAVRKGGTIPISGAANSSLVAFCETTYSYRGFTESFTIRPKRYVVWDVKSAKTIFELPPREQDEFKWYESSRKSKIPFDIAISPDGSLLALGGDDTLEIYSVSSLRAGSARLPAAAPWRQPGAPSGHLYHLTQNFAALARAVA